MQHKILQPEKYTCEKCKKDVYYLDSQFPKYCGYCFNEWIENTFPIKKQIEEPYTNDICSAGMIKDWSL